MIEEGDLTENSLLSDDEVAVKAMRLGLEWHYPGRIRIQQILAESFMCDWKRRQIVTDLIVYYGLGQFADADKSDLLIGVESMMALKSEDPIGYIKQLNDKKKRPIVQATNAIVGNNNSGIIQGQDLRFRDSKIITRVEHKADKVTENNIQKSKFDIKTVFQYLAWIAGIAGAILAWYKFFSE
ncbi:hypothetical protein [Dyadobacter diqingensis]|uniref:hypothetical protein n=1 Tax=Dyadobacter diqingensis TaxID=2938121 RepID=UPI0020C4B77C|nr:hypothetical protein [Dyadobacter diqingensis]